MIRCDSCKKKCGVLDIRTDNSLKKYESDAAVKLGSDVVEVYTPSRRTRFPEMSERKDIITEYSLIYQRLADQGVRDVCKECYYYYIEPSIEQVLQEMTPLIVETVMAKVDLKKLRGDEPKKGIMGDMLTNGAFNDSNT